MPPPNGDGSLARGGQAPVVQNLEFTPVIDMNFPKHAALVASSILPAFIGCGISILGTGPGVAAGGVGGTGGGASTTATGDGSSTASGGGSATSMGAGGATASSSTDSASSSAGSGGAGGGVAGSCPDGTQPHFAVLDFQFPTFGPQGCSTDNGLTFISAAAIIQETVLRLHIRKDDGSAFTQPSLLTLYVGMGPTCPNPVNVVKTSKAVVVGPIEQTVDLTIDPYDANWFPGETKEFWVGETEGGFASWRATSTVSIMKTCPGCTPMVSNVSPFNATLNQSMSFTIAGSCLPNTIAPVISNCANLAVTSTGAIQATFTCTPSFSTGLQPGIVKDKPGGVPLYNFNINVSPCTPVVTSVTPANATLNQSTKFTISGSCLPSTIAAFIAECANLVIISTSASQATFTCTPSFSTGVKNGVVKDMPGGIVLKSFTVSVN